MVTCLLSVHTLDSGPQHGVTNTRVTPRPGGLRGMRRWALPLAILLAVIVDGEGDRGDRDSEEVGVQEDAEYLDGPARGEEALRYLVSGNELSAMGKHQDAILVWMAASRLRPDSNVPWNNIANAYTALGRKDDALQAAEMAMRISVDYMSSTTLGNVLKSKKMYEEAENVLLEGCTATMARGEKWEHPFWSLANLYMDQGDLLEFVRWALEGLDRLSHPLCTLRGAGEHLSALCPELAQQEMDASQNLFSSAVQLGKNFASHRRLEEALRYFEIATRVQDSFPQINFAAGDTRDDPFRHAECVRCRMGSEGVGKTCAEALDLEGCEERWRDTNTKYLRMMAVRVMGCDWRNRDEDVADFMRMASLEILLNHTTEFMFECDGGLVCGAGGQPPMHLWGFELPLDVVRLMGSVHPLEVMDKMAQFGPTPEWAYPAWDEAVGQKFKIGYLSGDLLLDHPVGNMMKYVLPLHDLSRMDVTLFIVHEHQRAKATDIANKHFLGDVKVVFVGRGPSPQQQWDEHDSIQAADAINSAGICILFDLAGYTFGHRQDVLALRPAPVQAHYHGYMGTTGSPWIQTYVADRVIAPPEHSGFFSEKLALMPESFLGPSHRLTHQMWGQASGSNSDEHSTGEYERSVRRLEEGLPQQGFLVCYFNQHFKIDPITFKVWTDALVSLNSSEEHPPTLWMLRGSAVSHRNLRREFQAAGLQAKQLVFARRLKVGAHLRRASLCDVAVDTPMYNSGATGADTLYAGVPLITLPGNKCVGRMAAGFLKALRVNELVVRDHGEYLTLLLSLARSRERARPTKGLQALRLKLSRGVLRGAFYDVANWVADYEQMSRMVWDTFISLGHSSHIVPVRSSM